MAIQQLDLFGNPVTISTPKEEVEKVQPTKKQEVSLQDNTTVRTTGITVLPARDNANGRAVEKGSLTEQENDIVYSDNRIKVKLKGGYTQKSPATEDDTAIPARIISKGGHITSEEISGSFDLINIPDDATLNQKMYYKISVVAEWFGVNNSLIRYWENEFDILKPRLTRKGDRLFRVEDIKNLQIIYQLVKVRKFSIEGAKAYLKQNKQKANVHMELTDSLTRIRTFLVDLKATLNV